MYFLMIFSLQFLKFFEFRILSGSGFRIFKFFGFGFGKILQVQVGFSGLKGFELKKVPKYVLF